MRHYRHTVFNNNAEFLRGLLPIYSERDGYSLNLKVYLAGEVNAFAYGRRRVLSYGISMVDSLMNWLLSLW
jgi:hypothetical protein